VIEKLLPLDLRAGVRKGDAVRVHSSRGGGNSPEDYRLYHDPLEQSRTFTLAAAGGRPSNVRMPWFNLQWPGGGLLVAVGWSGQWHASVSRNEEIAIQAGMEDSRFYLKPGESIRTSRIVLIQWEGDDLYRSYNINRHLMLDYYLPRVNGNLVFPPVSKPTSYLELDTAAWRSTHGEQNQIEIIREAKELASSITGWTPIGLKGTFRKASATGSSRF
jgi:alpha-galactosidase